MALKARKDALLLSGVILLMLERSILEVPGALVALRKKFWAL